MFLYISSRISIWFCYRLLPTVSYRKLGAFRALGQLPTLPIANSALPSACLKFKIHHDPDTSISCESNALCSLLVWNVSSCNTWLVKINILPFSCRLVQLSKQFASLVRYHECSRRVMCCDWPLLRYVQDWQRSCFRFIPLYVEVASHRSHNGVCSLLQLGLWMILNPLASP